MDDGCQRVLRFRSQETRHGGVAQRMHKALAVLGIEPVFFKDIRIGEYS